MYLEEVTSIEVGFTAPCSHCRYPRSSSLPVCPYPRIRRRWGREEDVKVRGECDHSEEVISKLGADVLKGSGCGRGLSGRHQNSNEIEATGRCHFRILNTDRFLGISTILILKKTGLSQKTFLRLTSGPFMSFISSSKE